jgi:hypothetical protein
VDEHRSGRRICVEDGATEAETPHNAEKCWENLLIRRQNVALHPLVRITI